MIMNIIYLVCISLIKRILLIEYRQKVKRSARGIKVRQKKSTEGQGLLPFSINEAILNQYRLFRIVLNHRNQVQIYSKQEKARLEH